MTEAMKEPTKCPNEETSEPVKDAPLLQEPESTSAIASLTQGFSEAMDLIFGKDPRQVLTVINICLAALLLAESGFMFVLFVEGHGALVWAVAGLLVLTMIFMCLLNWFMYEVMATKKNCKIDDVKRD